jgi:excinuclease ABC subunit C
MHCVEEVVTKELDLHIPIAGLAKNDKHRTQELLFLKPDENNNTECITIQLKPESELFRCLTQMQDEVHRYAISFHRDKRSKHALHSELDEITGIGPKTKEVLLQHFKSIKRLQEAIRNNKYDEIISLVGNSKAELLIKHFK